MESLDTWEVWKTKKYTRKLQLKILAGVTGESNELWEWSQMKHIGKGQKLPFLHPLAYPSTNYKKTIPSS